MFDTRFLHLVGPILILFAFNTSNRTHDSKMKDRYAFMIISATCSATTQAANKCWRSIHTPKTTL